MRCREHRQLVLGCLTISALVLTGVACGDDDDKTPEPFKAAWVYVGPPGDQGWTYAHDQGRKAVEASIDNVETTFVENVSAQNAAAEIQKLIDAGNKIIFTTSFDFMDATVAMADANPSVYFEHCSGYKTRPNLATYFGQMHQARYLTGIVAGRMTTTHHIGVAAAIPIAEVISHVNAIALGVRSVDPSATVHVRWVGAWYDPTMAAQVANEMLNTHNVDVVFQDTDDAAAVLAAQNHSKWAVGYDSDVLPFYPNTVLTSAIWDWSGYYIERVKAAMNGSWQTQSYWGPMSDGIVKLGGWGPAVLQPTKDAVAAKQAEIVAGSFDVFCGEIRKQDGSVWVPAGTCMTPEEVQGQTTMHDLVEGVEGAVP